LNDHLETATLGKGRSLAIQNSVIKAFHEVTLNIITRHNKETPYVAVILDETSGTQMVSPGHSVGVHSW
jgi:hypothetical protein